MLIENLNLSKIQMPLRERLKRLKQKYELLKQNIQKLVINISKAFKQREINRIWKKTLMCSKIPKMKI